PSAFAGFNGDSREQTRFHDFSVEVTTLISMTLLNSISKIPNCLNKNLSETDSLPHVRNLSEMSRSVYLNGRQSEVNDERQESCNQGMVKSVPQGQQEGEGTASGRTCCYDRI